MNFIKIKNNEYFFSCDDEYSSVNWDDIMFRVNINDISSKKWYRLGYIFKSALFERVFREINSKEQSNNLMKDLITLFLENSLIEYGSLDKMFEALGFKKVADVVMNYEVPEDLFVYQETSSKFFFKADEFIELLKIRLEYNLNNNKGVMVKDDFKISAK